MESAGEPSTRTPERVTMRRQKLFVFAPKLLHCAFCSLFWVLSQGAWKALEAYMSSQAAHLTCSRFPNCLKDEAPDTSEARRHAATPGPPAKRPQAEVFLNHLNHLKLIDS